MKWNRSELICKGNFFKWHKMKFIKYTIFINQILFFDDCLHFFCKRLIVGIRHELKERSHCSRTILNNSACQMLKLVNTINNLRRANYAISKVAEHARNGECGNVAFHIYFYGFAHWALVGREDTRKRFTDNHRLCSGKHRFG